MDTGLHYFFTLPLWVFPSGVFRVLSVPPHALHHLVWRAKCGAESKVFQFKIKSSRQKQEKDANVSNVSQSLSSWVTTADVTSSRVGTEPLVTCALLHMSFRIISGQGTAAVWESWSGEGGGGADVWELRAEKGKGQEHRDKK